MRLMQGLLTLAFFVPALAACSATGSGSTRELRTATSVTTVNDGAPAAAVGPQSHGSGAPATATAVDTRRASSRQFKRSSLDSFGAEPETPHLREVRRDGTQHEPSAFQRSPRLVRRR